MKKVAVLIDGGFFTIIIHEKINRYAKPDDIMLVAQHLVPAGTNKELFRVYYYDASPYEGTRINPISKEPVNFSQGPAYRAIENYQQTLAEKDYVALRKGRLAFRGWKPTKKGWEKFEKGQSLIASDFKADFVQKAVDMKIGLDIAWISTKKIVDEIILVTADNDFVPAMKFARKEGLHVAIVNIQDLTSEMRQHADKVIDMDIAAILKS